VRIVVEASQDYGIEVPRTLRLNVDRVEVVEVLDQWYGPDYRYCKVKGGSGALYILRLDESGSEWHLTLFASARAQALSAQPCGPPRPVSSLQLGGCKWQ
jgi:hypothetical protein